MELRVGRIAMSVQLIDEVVLLYCIHIKNDVRPSKFTGTLQSVHRAPVFVDSLGCFVIKEIQVDMLTKTLTGALASASLSKDVSKTSAPMPSGYPEPRMLARFELKPRRSSAK